MGTCRSGGSIEAVCFQTIQLRNLLADSVASIRRCGLHRDELAWADSVIPWHMVAILEAWERAKQESN